MEQREQPTPPITLVRPAQTYQPLPSSDQIRTTSLRSASYDDDKDPEMVEGRTAAGHTNSEAHVRLNAPSRIPSAYYPTSMATPMDWRRPTSQRALPKTVTERLDPTIKAAETELKRYESSARFIGFCINTALALQVLFGALITGIAAAASPHGAQISTCILGGASTLVASVLARARGNGEPENSIMRAKDLKRFIRNVRATSLDHGDERPSPDDPSQHHTKLLLQINAYRTELNEMLASWDGDSGPAGTPIQKAFNTTLRALGIKKPKVTVENTVDMVDQHGAEVFDQLEKQGMHVPRPHINIPRPNLHIPHPDENGMTMRGIRAGRAIFDWHRQGEPPVGGVLPSQLDPEKAAMMPEMRYHGQGGYTNSEKEKEKGL